MGEQARRGEIAKISEFVGDEHIDRHMERPMCGALSQGVGCDSVVWPA